MSNLKRAFFWAAFYLAIIFVLGQSDYTGRPIINFASYFYLAVLLAVPITLFFPSIYQVPLYLPLTVWAGVYMVLLQILDRKVSANAGEFSVVVLDFVLLEAGVSFAYQLAVQLSHAESIMDALALSAFPNSVHDIDFEANRIKVEITRSRRYHRPLSVMMIEARAEEDNLTKETLKGVQHDLMSRFTFARIGQIIDDRIRQTDLILRDHKGHFIIMCPETDSENMKLLAGRIIQSVKERTDLHISYGIASFPDDAITFDDLLQTARERMTNTNLVPDTQAIALN